MTAMLGGLTGLLAVRANLWLVTGVILAVVALLAVVRAWGLEGFVVVLLVGSLVPLPTASVDTANFGLATLTVPLTLVVGVLVSRRRGIPVRVPYVVLYAALLGVAALSVVTSWLFWDPRVATGIARGYGHRWIGYQLTALFLLAFPFLAFAAGVVVSRLLRLERLYGWVFAVTLGLTMVVIVTWIQHPLNPLDAFAQGERPKTDNQWAAYLVVMATALAVHARRAVVRLVAVVALAIGALATFVSYVLGTWFGVLVAVTVIIWHRFRARGLCVWLGLLAAAGLVLQSTISAIAEQRALSQDVDRLGLWRSALTVWSKSPLLGVGPGNLPSYMEAYSAFPLGLVIQGYQQAHNMFLELLAENGITGIVILGAFLVLVVRTLARARCATVTESFGITAALGLLFASAGIASFGSGFIPTIGSAGYNALPMVAAVWFLIGCGVAIARAASPAVARSPSGDDGAQPFVTKRMTDEQHVPRSS
jgi:O-antigen ligase